MVDINKISYKNKNILVVGDIILDRHIWGDVDRISPEAPVPVVDVKEETMVPGGASNVVNNIISIGVQSGICGVVGDDEYGMILMDKLEKEGARVNGVMVDFDRPTTTKTRVIAHTQHVVRIDREKKIYLNNDIEEKIIDYIKSIQNDIDGVIIEDYGKGVITENVVKNIINIFNGNIPIAVDPKDGNFEIYKGVSIITPNHKEAQKMINKKAENLDELIEVGKDIINKLELKALLITRSRDGMLLFDETGIFDIPTVAKDEYDVTGAGDTVIAVLTSMLAGGLDYKKSAYISNIAAGIVVEKPGVVPVKLNELKKRLKNEEPNFKKIN